MTVDVHDVGLLALVDEDAAVELIQGGFQFLEGPVWDRRTGTLIFSDIPANTMYFYQPGAAATVFRQPSRHANGNTRDQLGRLLTCEHSGRQVSRTEPDGTVTPLATHFDGKKLNSPNDVVCRGDGAIFFTDPPYGLTARVGVEAPKELEFQGVYRIDTDGRLTLLVDDFDRPNGLAFSPDETLLYVNDTARRHIRVFVVDDKGNLSGDRVFAEISGDGRGAPDGMKLDRAGNVYCTGPGGVWVNAPDGSTLGRIQVPEQTANLAWGDADWQTLYLTASTSLYRVRMKAAGIPVP